MADTQKTRERLGELKDMLDRVGPPWGNPRLLASKVEDGFAAAYELLQIAEELAAALEEKERALAEALKLARKSWDALSGLPRGCAEVLTRPRKPHPKEQR